jgi:hypothetical protein
MKYWIMPIQFIGRMHKRKIWLNFIISQFGQYLAMTTTYAKGIDIYNACV